MRRQQVFKSLKDYQESIDNELFFKAYVELGEIYNLITFCDFKNHFKETFLKKIKVLSSNLENHILVEKAFKIRLNQLIRIMSIGDIFNQEEILLILTMRFELSLVNKILHLHNRVINEYNPVDIDEKIGSIKNHKKNAKVFTLSLGLMYKNWEVAMFDSNW